MTPKSKNFPKCLSGFLDGTPKYVSWPNLVKIVRCEVADRSSGLPHKKTWAPRTFSNPHFAQNGSIASKIPWTLSPLDASTYTEFALSICFLIHLIQHVHIHSSTIGRNTIKKKGQTDIYRDKTIKTYHYNYNVSTNYKSRALRLTISVKMFMYRSNSYMPRATHYVMQTIVFIIEILKVQPEQLV